MTCMAHSQDSRRCYLPSKYTATNNCTSTTSNRSTFNTAKYEDGGGEDGKDWSLTSILKSQWLHLMGSQAGDLGERVRVTYHEGSTLGVQLLRFDGQSLSELEKFLETQADSLESCHHERLVEDTVVAALWNSSFVRGAICAVHEKEARVFLLDYGITATYGIDELRYLPKGLVAQRPMYGVRVLLDEVPSLVGDIVSSAMADGLVDRVVRLSSFQPCSLTTARARIRAIEADPASGTLHAVFSPRTPRTLLNASTTGPPQTIQDCNNTVTGTEDTGEKCKTDGIQIEPSEISDDREFDIRHDEGIQGTYDLIIHLSENAYIEPVFVCPPDNEKQENAAITAQQQKNHTISPSVIDKVSKPEGAISTGQKTKSPPVSDAKEQKKILMELEVKVTRKLGPRHLVGISVALLTKAEQAVNSLQETPPQAPPQSLKWGARVLVRRSNAYARATIDKLERYRVRCALDDYDNQVWVRPCEVFVCPSSIFCHMSALMHLVLMAEPTSNSGPPYNPPIGSTATFCVLDYTEHRGCQTSGRLAFRQMRGFFRHDATEHGNDAVAPCTLLDESGMRMRPSSEQAKLT